MSRTTHSFLVLGSTLVLSLMGQLTHATTLPVTSGLILHLDASDPLNNGGTSLPGNGTSPTNWLDTSAAGNSTNFKVSDPNWFADGGAAWNNKPVFRFDGNDGYRITAGDFNTDPLGLHGVASGLTIITVINPQGNSVGGSNRWFGQTTARAFGHQGTPTGEALGVAHNSADISESVSSTSGISGVSTTHILASTHSRFLREFYFDGSLEGSNTTDWGATTTLDTPSPKGVGAYGNTGSGTLNQFYNGDLAEVIVFNRALSNSELNLVGFFLQEKYSVNGQFALPPVPEPSTGLLMMFGIATISLQRRSRKSHPSAGIV